MVDKRLATRGAVVAACSLGALALPFVVSQTTPGHSLRAIIHPDEPRQPAAVPTPPTDAPIVVGTDGASTAVATDASTTSGSTTPAPSSESTTGPTGTTGTTGTPSAPAGADPAP